MSCVFFFCCFIVVLCLSFLYCTTFVLSYCIFWVLPLWRNTNWYRLLKRRLELCKGQRQKIKAKRVQCDKTINQKMQYHTKREALWLLRLMDSVGGLHNPPIALYEVCFMTSLVVWVYSRVATCCRLPGSCWVGHVTARDGSRDSATRDRTLLGREFDESDRRAGTRRRPRASADDAVANCSRLPQFHLLRSAAVYSQKSIKIYLLAPPTITKSMHEITDTWGANLASW